MKAFQADLASEDPDAAAHFENVEDEEVVKVDQNFRFYWTAWKRLMDDRTRDGFGNVGSIFYSSLSLYGHDKCLSYDEFDLFIHVMSEMDDEYQKFLAEKRDADKENR